MTVVIELSKAIEILLEERAAELHIPTDQLAARLFNDALLKEVTTPIPAERKSFPTLEEIVASIKALPTAKNFHPATKSVTQVLADLEANPVAEPDITPEEWDRLWAEFEQQQKALDRANDIAEGRL